MHTDDIVSLTSHYMYVIKHNSIINNTALRVQHSVKAPPSEHQMSIVGTNRLLQKVLDPSHSQNLTVPCVMAYLPKI